MKTKNLYQEVCYYLSPSTSIANSLAMYSTATIFEKQDQDAIMEEFKNGFFGLVINLEDDVERKVIDEIRCEQIRDLAQHTEF